MIFEGTYLDWNANCNSYSSDNIGYPTGPFCEYDHSDSGYKGIMDNINSGTIKPY